MRSVTDETLTTDRVALHPAGVRARLEQAVGLARDRADAPERPRRPERARRARAAAGRRRSASRSAPRARASAARPHAGRTTRSGGRCGTPARRSPPEGRARGRRDAGSVQRPLLLLVAAGRAPRDVRLAVPKREARRERRARPRTRPQRRGSPSSSQNICARVPSGQPSAGMTGELWSQPPLGVAETMFPKRSATSRCTVSPRVGSPEPGTATASRMRGNRPSPGSYHGGRLLADERPPLRPCTRGRAACRAGRPPRRRRARRGPRTRASRTR